MSLRWAWLLQRPWPATVAATPLGNSRSIWTGNRGASGDCSSLWPRLGGWWKDVAAEHLHYLVHRSLTALACVCGDDDFLPAQRHLDVDLRRHARGALREIHRDHDLAVFHVDQFRLETKLSFLD
jgi:hypothetical protein